MDKKTFDRGREIRSSVLGKEFVDNAFQTADDFTRPLQELVTEYCWGACWGREGLPRKTRSMLNLAMISVLNRPNELKNHIKGALRNGVTPVEIREILLQVAIYAACPRRRFLPNRAGGIRRAERENFQIVAGALGCAGLSTKRSK